MSQLNPVSPLSQQALPKLVRTTGQTCVVGQNNLVDSAGGGTTVKLPTSFAEDSVLIVEDSSGNAAANNIVVDGNGQLINGRTSVTINANRGALSFVRDGANAQWAVVPVVRQLDGALVRLYTSADLALAVAAISTGVQVLSLALSARDYGIATLGGNFTQGAQFWALRSNIIASGVRFAWAGSNRTIKVNLWDETGAIVATGTGQSGVGPTVTQISFAASVALAASTAVPGAKVYIASIYDMSGSEYTKQLGTVANFATFFQNASLSSATRDLRNGLCMGNAMLFTAGDARPLGTAATEIYPIDLVVS